MPPTRPLPPDIARVPGARRRCTASCDVQRLVVSPADRPGGPDTCKTILIMWSMFGTIFDHGLTIHVLTLLTLCPIFDHV